MRLVVHDGEPGPAELRSAADAIGAAGIVAYPTETFYGLAVDPRSETAVAKLMALKGRSPHHPLPLIAADERQVEAIASWTPLARRLAEGFWPGPLTLVLECRARLAPDVIGPANGVAVRVPAHPVARGLARAAGVAITSTSANLSGGAPAASAEDVEAAFGDGVSIVIDAGRAPGGLPSTIVDARGSTPVLVRDGAAPWARVLEFLEQ
jgi:L-threonylcarbamoyladenylate synthase